MYKFEYKYKLKNWLITRYSDIRYYSDISYQKKSQLLRVGVRHGPDL